MTNKKKAQKETEVETPVEDVVETSKVEVADPKVSRGVSVDIGTMNIISARKTEDGIQTKRIRDCFLDMDIDAKKMLKLSGVSYIEHDDTILILGDPAIHTANIFGREVRRPIANGLISSQEIDALEVLSILIENVVGKPVEENEVCYFSVPAAPIDNPGQDVLYHKAVFEKILDELGYDAVASNEAMAIVFSECADTMFSGLGISFGCLTPDTRVMTRRGYVPISQIIEGDEALSREGKFQTVSKTWVKPYKGLVYEFHSQGRPEPVTLTGNHEVWTYRDGKWQWIAAEYLKKGDVMGEPVIDPTGKNLTLNWSEKITNGPTTKKNKEWSHTLGRFLGYFLADGHVYLSEGRSNILVDFGPEESEYVQDYQEIVKKIFEREVSVVAHGNAQRCQFSHRSLAVWLEENCYQRDEREPLYSGLVNAREDKVKVFPLPHERITSSCAEGILIGLVRGDGWINHDVVSFSNSSVSLIQAFHLLCGQLGFMSTINRRDPRDSSFTDGRTIKAENSKDEWTCHVSGYEGLKLKDLVLNMQRKKSSKNVFPQNGYRCTRITTIVERYYEGDVYDLTMEGDPSFCAPYMILHNSGMTNVALSYNTMSALEFSVQRGGDFIDASVARALGTTASRICTIKEKGINLANPSEGDEKTLREREAIATYYRALIGYALDNIANEFKKIQDSVDLPTAIPIVIGGGTSMAPGFIDIFKEVFEKKRRRFPIEISEIRHAEEPLTAVSHGLLVQALQEYQD